jgi:hypothetical protein
MKIVFLDEYSICGCDLSTIKSMGEYIGYETTSAEQTLERCKGAEVVITNKVILDAETLAALEVVRVKLEAQYPKIDTNNDCPTIQSMLQEYNSYVDSIAKLADVKAEFAHKRPRLSIPADQLLAVARMVDNNVASWLVSNDVVEKADLVKRNKKLIEDINKKLSRKMQMDREQTHALSVFKKAERYFNETCLQNNKK